MAGVTVGPAVGPLVGALVGALVGVGEVVGVGEKPARSVHDDRFVLTLRAAPAASSAAYILAACGTGRA